MKFNTAPAYNINNTGGRNYNHNNKKWLQAKALNEQHIYTFRLYKNHTRNRNFYNYVQTTLNMHDGYENVRKQNESSK